MNLSIGVIGSVSLYFSYKVYTLYNQYKKLLELIEQNIWDNHDNVKIYDHYIEISYSYMTKPYTVRLPFDSDRIPSMAQYMVFAQHNDTEVDITQQPGIPYLLSPDVLNVDNITVYNLLDDDKQSYIGEEIPMYG